MIRPRVPIRVAADWVLPIEGPPIRNGAVLVGLDGRIKAIGPADHVPESDDYDQHDYPGAALLPGLVNAHTHLELTGLAGRVEYDDFSHWIRAVRELKASLGPEWFAAAAKQGVRDAFAAGMTFVFDTGDSGAVFDALTAAGGAGVVYQEVFGPHPEQAPASLRQLDHRTFEAQKRVGRRVVVGLSPHAPYTVSAQLYIGTAALSEIGVLKPLAVHLAESAAETAFVVRGEGPFAEAWRARGIPSLAEQWPRDPAARRSPVAWLDAHQVLSAHTLVIHAVQLDEADIECLAERRVGIAHCPLSNRRHGHGDAPIAALREAWIRVGIGTDSVLSVGRLDLFAEMRAARAIASLTAAEALAMGTQGGARLLTWRPDFGTLQVGHWGDLVAVAIPEPAGYAPEEQVLAASPDDVVATYASGRLVYRVGQPT